MIVNVYSIWTMAHVLLTSEAPFLDLGCSIAGRYSQQDGYLSSHLPV